MTPDEFLILIQRLSSKNIHNGHAVFMYFDQDLDGVLSYEEFRRWWTHPQRDTYLTNPLILKAYNLYLDYSVIQKPYVVPIMTTTLFHTLLSNMNKDNDNGDTVFDRMDLNDDGVISFSEFCHWLRWF
jgi:Ca2+-binding EF-hand superfamily protein